jgi:DNA-binding transcriptional MerR regulator
MESKMDEHEEIFSIQQVSLKLNIPKATLRFWEKELNGIIVPLRTRGGQRRYTLDQISAISEVKKMRKSGMRLSEIRRYLANRSMNSSGQSKISPIDSLADHIAEIVRSEIYNFFNFTDSSMGR